VVIVCSIATTFDATKNLNRVCGGDFSGDGGGQRR
jgi:hypothetical protein